MEATTSGNSSLADRSARSETTALPTRIVAAIVFLRVALGLWFLIHEDLIEKIPTWTSKTLPTTFASWIKNPAGYGFYQAFLKDVALPNAEFFHYFILSWELFFAVCLIFGLGMRVVIPLQIFANLNYILAKTYISGGANLDRLTIIILVTLFIISAGRYYGVDKYLRQRFSWFAWL